MVNEQRASRIALILRADSRREILAATQIAIFFVREVGRTEAELLRLPSIPTGRGSERAVRTVLFAAATVRASVRDRVSSAVLERVVRAYVERTYARQGITPIEYDLQML